MNAPRPDSADQKVNVGGTPAQVSTAKARLTISEPLDPQATPDPNQPTEENRALSGRPNPNSVFGSYQILEELSRGGMGVVYKACHVPTGAIVALKTMRFDRQQSPVQVQRFACEVEAVQQLKHPNVVPIRDVGEQNNCPYFTMDFLAGGSLAEHRRRLHADPRAAVIIMEQVARGVDHAHKSGILHRDLKPGNILLDEMGKPLVADFGLAKFLDSDHALTQSGQMLGTPAYMAPEQATGRSGNVDARADVWSLGIILYELLTGRRPFDDEDQAALIQQIEFADPVKPSMLRPGLSTVLDEIILGCLAKDSDDRYATAGALADDLVHWLEDKAIIDRRPSWPTRVFRTVRRHPRISTLTLLCPIVLVAALVALRHSDPDRPLRSLQDDLAQGKKVEFLAESGPPVWHRWRTGLPRELDHVSGGYTSFGSLGIDLLELIPDPQKERYIFQAEVRQNHTTMEDGAVGIYILNSRFPVDGEQNFYAALEFSEDGIKKGKAAVYLYRYGESDGKSGTYQNVHIPLRAALTKPVKLGTWRKLKVQVTPESLAAWVDDVSLGEIRRSKFDFLAKLMLKNTGNLILKPTFSPRDSLGLYVYRGSASFRRVTLEPLPE